MPSNQQHRFKTTQDWNNFISTKPPLTGQDLFNFRKKCYDDIEALRGRPLLVYATKFLDPTPPETPNLIDLSDVDGFTDLVNSTNDNKAVDILLHSPGGRPDATERIVSIIREKYDNVAFLIPHSAYSAATMLALSGNEIILHPSATLGPIDPQINGIPARSIKRGFDNAKKSIMQEGPESLPAYIPLIEKYSLDLLEICEDSEKLSKELVRKWLGEYMFKNKKGSARKITKAVKFFSNYDQHLLHSRPILYDKLKEYGLNIIKADTELSGLLWEAHVLLNGFFNGTPFVKLFECTNGVSWGKQVQITQIPRPQVKIQTQK